MKENVGKLAYFLSIDGAKFRRPVVPGDVLRIEVEFLKAKMGIVKVHGVAKVGDELAAEADLMFAFVKTDAEKK
jgi:3-hydroxyacyl-[acyl-carrier-protein] dehydratase